MEFCKATKNLYFRLLCLLKQINNTIVFFYKKIAESKQCTHLSIIKIHGQQIFSPLILLIFIFSQCF